MSILGGQQPDSHYRAVDLSHKGAEIDDKDLGNMMTKEQVHQFQETV